MTGYVVRINAVGVTYRGPHLGEARRHLAEARQATKQPGNRAFGERAVLVEVETDTIIDEVPGNYFRASLFPDQ